jgi:Aspartyl/Asparaginyl beta-hydroxylase
MPNWPSAIIWLAGSRTADELSVPTEPHLKRNLQKAIKYVSGAVVFLVLLYYFTIPVVVLILCGLWDISRNTNVDAGVFRQYFLTNGVATWLASPLNILLDLLALPFINKGVYQLEDLSSAYQTEINDLLREAESNNLVDRLANYTAGLPRAMFFFKWYGKNLKTSIDIPAFHREYKFIRTIGVSTFRKRENTSRHFGPFRATLRVLYCLNDINDENAFIRVGRVENHWKEKRLFIFDDTLLHQSFNDTDQPRYCLFVDILRPSSMNLVFDFFVRIIRLLFKGVNGLFYKNWKLIGN